MTLSKTPAKKEIISETVFK